ncbi:uncharacterized protein LOC124406237 [Diprion similis]|uniref:uncharacterized protein LOC124406237 n=1 Tax=Diprion similis TaxID=362088 RepID=UPI001EF95BFB|nr:uncharacterized protein LOC124406237 [Diprion similis]
MLRTELRKCGVFKTPNLTFHSFPKAGLPFFDITNHFGISEKIDRKRAWERALLINKKWSTTNKKVCSLHFKVDDYVLSEAERENREIYQENLKKKRSEISQQLDKARTKNMPVTTEESTGLHETEHVVEENSLASFEIPQIIDEHESTNAGDEDEMGRSVESVSVNGDDIISRIITNDQELSTMTGIPNFEVLQTLIDIINIHNVSYALLTVIFRLCSVENCRRTVFRMLDVLSSGLKFVVNWPSEVEVSKNIPLCFKEFTDVRVVIDCIEIFIEKSKNLCCQSATYSNYKSGYTIKFMTGVFPRGLITFIDTAPIPS